MKSSAPATARDRVRRLLLVAALTVAATVVALATGRIGVIRTLDWKIYDQHVRRSADPASARRDIVVVSIDETSIRRLEPVVGRWPWPRLVHGSVIDFLRRAPARVIAYDLLLTERDRRTGFDVGGETWDGAASDLAFAESVAAAGNVVMLADATYEGLRQDGASREPTSTPAGKEPGPASDPVPDPTLDLNLGESFEVRSHLLLPYPELARAARAFGHNYLVLDPDGPVRRIVPFVRHGRGFLPSLPVTAVSVAENIPRELISLRANGDLQLGARRVPLVLDTLPRFQGDAGDSATPAGRRLLVNFRGPAVLEDGRTTTYRDFSFYDLFYSEQQLLAGETPFVDPALFRDAIVFVGITAAGLHDVFVVPFGETGGKMPGTHLYANVVDQLLTGRFVRPVSAWARLAATVLLGAIGAFALVRLRVRTGIALALIALAAFVAAAAWAFRAGLFVPVVQPGIAAAFGAVGGLGYRYLVEGREKRAVKRLFSRYLSKDVYEQVLANPQLAELGGKRRDMSVLFSDIRGFTAVTERGEPEALVAQLNDYFSRMVDIVFAHRGTLDKFVGDMVMALFGAPLGDADHADHAVSAGLAMVAELDRLNERWRAEGRPTLGIGIGINSGEMIAGNIGAEKIRSYTVIGDNVNLGARLESLNKDYGTSIIISGHTRRRLRGQYDLRPLGEVVVKGKTVPVDIYEVRARAAATGVAAAAVQEGRSQ